MHSSEKESSSRNIILALIGISLIAILFRTVFSGFFGQFPNFTPIAALALFSGAMLWNRKWMFVFPIGAMLISDTIKEIKAPGTGFYPDMAFVYGSFFAIIAIGMLIRNSKKPLNIVAASLAGSILFFIVTNFGAWMSIPEYTRNFSGLMTSYVAGLPFFKFTLAGDLFFNAVFFGGFYLVTAKKNVETQKA
jgi:hypothetical protein